MNRTTAIEIAWLLRPLEDRELEGYDGVKDDSGIWTFPDGSRLQASYKPLPAFAGGDMTGRLGTCYYDVL